MPKYKVNKVPFPVEMRAFTMRPKKPTYEELKQECLKKKKLFEDKDFPPVTASLFTGNKPNVKFKWKRPKDIAKDPRFIADGATRTDIQQGELGDCWLLAAIASLTLNTKLMQMVVPPGQEFDDKYAGIFKFQFWQAGEWVEVVVDDFLPTFNGRLVFVHSTDRSEFWSALLEKAYAKLAGSYESLKGGSTSEAMEDFSGGLVETYSTQKAAPNFQSIIRNAVTKKAMLACCIDVRRRQNVEEATAQGLITGHAYSVTGMDEVKVKGQAVTLMRMRNPWGRIEWKGPWSDKSDEWKNVSDSDKTRLAQVDANDGEFWMSFEDFKKQFSRVEICNIGPKGMDDDDEGYWSLTEHESRWVPGSTAGGCRNFANTFWTNPQFHLVLNQEDVDPDDKTPGCSFIIALYQMKTRRRTRRRNSTIGFSIYELPGKLQSYKGQLPKAFFARHRSQKRSAFINMREICQRFKLKPGHYVIIPSTYKPRHEGRFLLRVFTEKGNPSSDMIEEIGADIPEDPSIPIKKLEDEKDEVFKNTFLKLAGEDQQIGAKELCIILNKIAGKDANIKCNFSQFSCRSMVALLDCDASRTLGYGEFKFLWDKIRQWVAIYKKHDVDKSGTIDAMELRNATADAGFQLNNRILDLIISRYADDKLQVDLDDFIVGLLRLEMMFRIFQTLDNKDKTGSITLNLQQWLMLTIC
uniref:calpain-9-like isoform X2 n=1 Tax=Myxine glutinosa TaxID=7769 RepID=UPI00358FB033